jgi:uncharacterized protein YbjT (DUF2867 family)
MIVVTGATGKVGQALLPRLAERGLEHRVMVRDRARAEAALGASAPPMVVGDLADPASLVSAFAGADSVFLVAPPAPDDATHFANGLAAAKAAGVRRVVKLSAIGATESSPIRLAKVHAVADRALRESGLVWTTLHPTFFHQNTLAWAPGIAASGQVHGCAGEGRATVIDARDIAAVAAEALAGSDQDGRALTLTGEEPLTHADQARIIAEALGRSVTYVDLPREDYRAALTAAGVPDWYRDDLVRFEEVIRAGHAAAASPTVRQLLGRAPIRFEEFVRDHAEQFVVPARA